MDTQYDTVERKIYIEASPSTVFDVVSRPEHIRQWWPDEARFEPVPGSTGEIVFGDPDDAGSVVSLSVMDVDPPRSFTFRWTHPADEDAVVGNSLLVTFRLEATGGGTTLTLTESGFRDMDWDEAKVRAEHQDHSSAWDHFLGRLVTYAATVGAVS